MTNPVRAAACRALTSAFLLAIATTAAGAHALLRHATPGAGSVLHAPPAELTLDFSEGIEPRFSTITVTDKSGARVDQNDAHLVAGQEARFAIGLKTLAPGVYKVTWHAVAADDGHKTQGSYAFTLAP